MKLTDQEKLIKIERMLDGLYSEMEYDYARGLTCIEPYCLRLKKIKGVYSQ